MQIEYVSDHFQNLMSGPQRTYAPNFIKKSIHSLLTYSADKLTNKGQKRHFRQQQRQKRDQQRQQ